MFTQIIACTIGCAIGWLIGWYAAKCVDRLIQKIRKRKESKCSND